MVTNPATRDWTVTASLFATLNEMYGNRTVCGIGRGDSAVRVTNGEPTTLATLRDAIARDPRSWPTAQRSTTRAATLRFPWGADSRLDVWVAAYGPKALALDRRGRRRLHPAARRPRHRGVDASRRCGRRPRRPGRDPAAVTICVAAPAYVGDDLAHQRDQCRWFGGMVGNHVADIVARYGARRRGVPAALTDYIKGRQGYDYNEHGRAGNTHTDFVPDEIVDRFCILGPVERPRRAARRSCRRSASTSSPSTCSTTPRKRRCRPTASTSSRPSPPGSSPSAERTARNSRARRLVASLRSGRGDEHDGASPCPLSTRVGWGWHRLTEPWADTIVADAAVRPGELVLDIGAGTGVLRPRR